MVVNVIKWRSRPPLRSRKFAASITVNCLKGVPEIGGGGEDQGASPPPEGGLPRVAVEIRWKGSKGNGLKALSRKVKVNRTRKETVGQNGVVRWDEEFRSVCSFSGYSIKDGGFNPWEVAFIFFNASDGQPKQRLVAEAAILDLAEFASVDDEQQLEIIVPHIHSNGAECNLSLFLRLQLTEVRTNDESSEAILRSSTMPLSPCFGVPSTVENDEPSSLKKGLRKVKKPTKGNNNVSTGSENSDSNRPFDSDSLDCSEEGLSEENKEDFAEDSFGYGDLITANLAGGVFDLKRSCEDEDMVYYSNRRPKVDDSSYGDCVLPEQTLKLSPRIGILAWKRRKLSFKPARVRGEPLLKKEYGESGGDDIDHDRRRLGSSDESSSFEVELQKVGISQGISSASLEPGVSSATTSLSFEIGQCKTEEESLSITIFGEDRFTVGSWEMKEIVSRDGSLKLRTQVFFASIDQRHEKAGGESACTPLVVVIAHWLNDNHPSTPTRSEFDALIAQGSLHWRNLCAVDSYMARFPNKHFDLDTVLEAQIRPLTVIPEKSFIGFFRPEGAEDNEDLGFLHGAMSFDDIWDEISRSEPSIYIVSWNDHFFALKVDSDACYVIDTLGERLKEGCRQAYVLKFDEDTRMKVEEDGEEKGGGKEMCREYMKRFMAGIAVREVEGDVKKGRVGAAPLHHRLQIDFHHTQLHVPPYEG